MLEPYVWYDPHEVIKQLEWQMFQSKFRRVIETEHVIKILKSALAETSYQYSKNIDNFNY